MQKIELNKIIIKYIFSILEFNYYDNQILKILIVLKNAY